MGAWEGGVCYTVLCAYYMLSTVSAHRAISNTQPGSGYVFLVGIHQLVNCCTVQ